MNIDNLQLVCLFHGATEIHDRQQKKYKGLDKGHKDAHGHDRQRCKEGAGQHEQYHQHQLMAGNIAEKPERKG